MARCSDCERDDRPGGQYCEACGTRIEPESAEPEPWVSLRPKEDEGAEAPSGEDDGSVLLTTTEEAAPSESKEEPESTVDWMQTEGEASTGSTDSTGEPEEPEAEDDLETAGEGLALADSTAAEEEPTPPPKTGYLVFPDSTEQPIPPSQWLIGRADLSKYLRDPDKANEISRGHLTVFQDGDRFFVEDGKTMVQKRASTNKTWVIRGGTRMLVTGTGRTELQDADEIDVAELVKLQFVMK